MELSMKTLHPAASGSFHPAANPPCVRSLQLSRSAKTLSQKRGKKREMCLSESLTKNISRRSPCRRYADLWVRAPAGKVRGNQVIWPENTMFVRGGVRAGGGQVDERRSRRRLRTLTLLQQAGNKMAAGSKDGYRKLGIVQRPEIQKGLTPHAAAGGGLRYFLWHLYLCVGMWHQTSAARLESSLKKGIICNIRTSKE